MPGRLGAVGGLRASNHAETGVPNGWVRNGQLPPGPWTTAQLTRAAAQRSPAGGAASAEHGTVSRWRGGCLCDECRTAHNADLRVWRTSKRLAFWESRVEPLLARLGAGEVYRETIADLGLSPSAIAAHRQRDPAFGVRLDEALTAGRDPDLRHGTGQAWKRGCRCPGCREYHEASR